MHDTRGEPVEVWLRNGRPARFVWRGRMYTVLLVVDSSIAAAAQAAADNVTVPDTTAASGAPVQPLPGGRERWLVEAVPERSAPASRFEMWRDPATDRWSLYRT